MIENAFIFVSDALRWDYLPDRVQSRGTTIKTVAASTVSPTSFASIASGLHPPEHGVQTFFHRLTEEHRLAAVDEVNASFWEMIVDGLYDVLGQDPETSEHLSDISPPFIHVERELSTHAPYNQWTEEYGERRNQGQSVPDYFDGKLGNWEFLRGEYEAGAETAGKRFEERIELLADRGLLDDTLLIFTSDHGELLGEYGEWSHSTPVTPELVYVPTVIVHPEKRAVKADIFRHVDILPTVFDAMDRPLPWSMSGVSAFATESPQRGFCQYYEPKESTEVKREAPWRRRYEYLIRSVWDSDGGWAFNQSGTVDRSRHAIRMLKFVTPNRPRDLLRSRKAVYHHLKQTRRFGTPGFGLEQAHEDIATVISGLERLQPDELSLSEDKKSQLEDLGYI